MKESDGKEGPMHSMENLSKLPRLQELTPEAVTAFRAFDRAALSTGVIPRKYKELMAVTVALTTQCAYCIELHRRAAQHAGATEQELAEAILVPPRFAPEALLPTERICWLNEKRAVRSCSLGGHALRQTLICL
jgi:AhpD family alkylhydroperoxidase